MLSKCYSITLTHASCNKDKIKSWQYKRLAKYNSHGEPWKRVRPKFDHEVIQIRKRGPPLQKPSGASKWQSTNEKFQNFLVLYNTGRPFNSVLGLHSPNVERNYFLLLLLGPWGTECRFRLWFFLFTSNLSAHACAHALCELSTRKDIMG